MSDLFEPSDALNKPLEAYLFNSDNEIFPVKPHWHHFGELIYMIKGTAAVNCNNENYIVKKGEMMIYAPTVIHGINSADGNPVEFYAIKFDINKVNVLPAYFPKLYGIFCKATKSHMPVIFGVEESEKMDAERVFRDCVEEYKNKNFGYDLIIQNHLYYIVTKIIRLWQKHGLRVEKNKLSEDMVYEIYSITEYIDTNIKNGLFVSEIAEKCNMSYSNFAKKFREIYGMTCKEYIDRTRIYMVEDLLSTTDNDLTYICQETGFSDCSHMIMAFKKSRGITPKQFRDKVAISENV